MNIARDNATPSTATLGEIAAASARAVEAFDWFGLDYCCGGGEQLTDAAARAGLDPAVVIDRLDAVHSGHPPETELGTDELMTHIVEVYHARHRAELPELIDMADRIESVHQFEVSTPHGLADTLRRLGGRLSADMAVEEHTLFPAVRRGDWSAVADTIGRLRADRFAYAEDLHEIETLTGHFSLPECACRTWQALYFQAARLDDELRYHVHLEYNVLFPRLQRDHQVAATP